MARSFVKRIDGLIVTLPDGWATLTEEALATMEDGGHYAAAKYFISHNTFATIKLDTSIPDWRDFHLPYIGGENLYYWQMLHANRPKDVSEPAYIGEMFDRLEACVAKPDIDDVYRISTSSAFYMMTYHSGSQLSVDLEPDKYRQPD